MVCPFNHSSNAMKNLIVAVIVSLISFGAHAHYCDTNRDPANCWRAVAEGNLDGLRVSMSRVMKDPVIPNDAKQFLQKDHQRWAEMVERRCRNNACVALAAWDRLMAVQQYAKKFNPNFGRNKW